MQFGLKLSKSIYLSTYQILDNLKPNRTQNCVIFGKIEVLLTFINIFREDQHHVTFQKEIVINHSFNKNLTTIAPVSQIVNSYYQKNMIIIFRLL